MPKRKLKKGRIRWLARDGGNYGYYNESKEKMRKDAYDIFQSNNCYFPKEYEKEKGIKLRKGQQIKVRLVEMK